MDESALLPTRAKIIYLFDPLASDATDLRAEYKSPPSYSPPSLISPAEGVFYPDVAYSLERVSSKLEQQYNNVKVYQYISDQRLTIEGLTQKSSVQIQDSMRSYIVINPKVNNITLTNCVDICLVFTTIVNKLELHKCFNVRVFCINLPCLVSIESTDSVCISCTTVSYSVKHTLCCVNSNNINLKLHLLITYIDHVQVFCGLALSQQYSTAIWMSSEQTYTRPYTLYISKTVNQITDLMGKGGVYSSFPSTLPPASAPEENTS